MDRILIRGGNRLTGKLPISGAKNSALTLMPCALLTEEPLTLRNLPRLADVDSFGHLLNQLGASTEIEGARPTDFGRVMTMRAGRLTSSEAPLVARASRNNAHRPRASAFSSSLIGAPPSSPASMPVIVTTTARGPARRRAIVVLMPSKTFA
jgi:UDP-N-acetylglucosamine enolpyruvyl transferase